ncbi:MAG: hypothetical protein MI861_21870 [Pirellulales bacterium]|nr:hypothetical protein [Pirellulales bacterium]
MSIQTEADPACVLMVYLNCARPDNWILTNNNAVTPADIARYIREALADGWIPTTPGNAHCLNVEVKA